MTMHVRRNLSTRSLTRVIFLYLLSSYQIAHFHSREPYNLGSICIITADLQGAEQSEAKIWLQNINL